MPADNEERHLREPSKIPGDTTYEQASDAVTHLFTRSPKPSITDKAKEEKDDLYRSFDEVRLDAKKKVFGLAPKVLKDYRKDLKNDTDARRSFSWSIFSLVIVWLLVVVLIIVLT